MFRPFLQLSHAQVRDLAVKRARTGALPRRRAVAAAAAMLAALACIDAAAQEKPADAAATSQAAVPGQQLEVVTVTATRRREPLRDVPLRVETLSAESLERAGGNSLEDYIGGLPGVHITSDGGPGRGQVHIRGVSVGALGAPTVGTYIDEVAFGSSTAFVGEASFALDMALLDLHHIELLRGPQGTLYGAGAMGGLIKYVTNQPDTTAFSGKAGVGVRSTRNGALGYTENAVLNIPLSSGVAGLRVAAFNDHDGGYITGAGRAAGEHINDGNSKGARVSLLLEPMAKMSLKLTGAAQDIKRNGTGFAQYSVATAQPLYADLTHKLSVSEPYSVKTRLLSADLEYDFGWARFNLIASTQHFDGLFVLDATDIVGSPAFSFVSLNNTTGLRKQTEEVRLTSARGTIEWILGAYHDKEKGDRFQRLWGSMAADKSELTLVTVGQPSSYVENAVYGDLTYNPTQQLSFTAGARVARNKQVYGTVTNGTPDFTTPADDDAKTYLATARYSLDKVSSVYFRAASGYRPGGPNPPAIDATGKLIPNAPTSFSSDTLWSYEFGYKADLLDKRLFLELALFDIRWDKLQQPLPLGATTLTTNAGKAEMKGLELATRYRLDEHWNLDASMSWTDAKLAENAPALGPAGSRLPNSPKFAGSIGGRYLFDLAGKPSYAGLSARYNGQRNAGFEAAGSSVPNFSMPAYTIADAQFGVEFGRWQLAAFARNLADKRGLAGADAALTAFGGPLRATPVQPRTIGMNLTVEF